MRLLPLVVVACLFAGCGESQSPVAPTPTPPVSAAPALPSIAGHWVGSMALTLESGQRGEVMVVADFHQNDGSISGTWHITTAGNDNAGGDVAGRLEGIGSEAMFVGTATLTISAGVERRPCLMRAELTGQAARYPLRLTAPQFSSSECAAVTGVVWTLER